MSDEDQEIIDEFVIESNEHLSHVETQLLTIESNGDNIDVDLVNMVFRAIHSIKGAAGFLGLVKINDLAHSLENILDQMRNCELIPSSQIIDTMLKSSDLLTTMLNNLDDTEQFNISDLVIALDAIAENKAVSTNAAVESGQADNDQTAEPITTTNDQTPTETAAEVIPQESELAETIPAPTNPTTPKIQEQEPMTAGNNETPNSESQVEQNIRVSVSVLDQLMNLAGELVLSRNQILQAVSNSKDSGLDSAASGLDQVTSELQEAIMQTRMQSIGTVFTRFTRVVRDLGAKLNKQCHLDIEGKEVEVDKTIIEAISDPLTHLIRNSMDHGIETPEERVAKGKPAEGHISLKAYHEAGKVQIEIRDNGAGIDPAKLKAKAIIKEIITADQAEQMSNRDIVRLIFHPGFSMAEKLTDVSGRGVGMDVVRSNIEKIGGSVDVDSEVGVGTKVTVTLPLTLAIIPSLIIESSKSRFAIPQTNISELVRIRKEDLGKRINHVKGAEMLRLRGALLPLIRLNHVLTHEKVISINEQSESEINSRDEVRNIVVVESGQGRYGLVVESLHDSEEIVVKPLGRHLLDCKCLSGATILGDGHVALILDTPGIGNHANLELLNEQSEYDSEHNESTVDKVDTHSVLLFTNHPSEHFALSMSVVQRVERIETNQIEVVGGQELLHYRGTSMPLFRLENIIAAMPLDSVPDRIYVAIIEINGREVGLVAPQLEDIQDVDMVVDTVTFVEAGVVGSLVIDQHATRLLDVFGMIEKVKPDWFTSTKSEAIQEDRDNPITILLAEDSDFFRRQVKGFMEEAGYNVIDAEDGAIAWNIMTSGEYEFDLVVTDIEMPNMNGFELSEKIRATAAFSGMPIIALTSLASDEHRKHGEAVGVNDYQIKMDREKLLASIQRFTNTNSHSNKRAQQNNLVTAGV
ncbi:MAG: hybrid sensor histidine kinase/response regulator [Blastopirellula sp.]|nr:MAG: hybrid sensor histidine kinase/response regulator [Blastopirellula sp.]